ncbi:MAG: 23S rRNA pseudouridine(2605) synthase RluB [Gammaproteobacteria bacterium]|jgi:23S rRNA pseudouridine2605 synthase
MNRSTKATEKLQKVLARAGLGSRREMEQWIQDGRIKIDDHIASIGDRVHDGNVIRLDGRVVTIKSTAEIRRRVIIYNKPNGEICSRKDPENRPTVFDNLPNLYQGRWLSVGRLDINTSGLLLFTNDGELANRLMHPSTEIERQYAVRIHGDVLPVHIQRLRKGVELEDGIAKFDAISSSGGEGRNQWFKVALKEGRNREVRRMWESQELEVSRLIRIQYGPISLPRTLPRGVWNELDDHQVNELAKVAGLPPRNIERRVRDNKQMRKKRIMSRRRRAPNRNR